MLYRFICIIIDVSMGTGESFIEDGERGEKARACSSKSWRPLISFKKSP
jgi:hypothetical protein